MSECTPQVAAALVAAQAEIRNPQKNREVTVKSEKGSYKFAYATLDGILDMVRPILARHGLCVVQTPIIDAGKVSAIRTVILHKSGEAIVADCPCITDRAGPQALGSAITYARRYGLTAILCLAAEDEDDDGNAAEGNRATVTRKADATPPERFAAARETICKAKGLDAGMTAIAAIQGRHASDKMAALVEIESLAAELTEGA